MPNGCPVWAFEGNYKRPSAFRRAFFPFNPEFSGNKVGETRNTRSFRGNYLLNQPLSRASSLKPGWERASIFSSGRYMTACSASSELQILVKHCLTGDQDAMLSLIDRFQGQVFGLCYRMLGQRQDAEDAAQETFVRVLRSLHRWDSSRDFEPWLLAIAGNRCRTALASRKRRPAPEALVEQLADRTPDEGAGKHLAEEVQLALASVRDEYRQAFLLFHEHELSYGEIASAMAVPLGTVKTWVHRARRELIQRLHLRGTLEGHRHAMS